MRFALIIWFVFICAVTCNAQLQQPVYIGNTSWVNAAQKIEPKILPVTRHKMWMEKTVYPNERNNFQHRKIDPKTKILRTTHTVPVSGMVSYKGIPLPVPEISEAAPLLTRDNADFNINYTDKQHGFAGTTSSDFAEDDAHNIWIASEAGLIKYNGYHYYLYAQTNLFPALEINSLAFDSQKRLWLATAKGLYYIQHDSLFTSSSRDVDFSNMYCFKVQEDKQQRIWVSTKQNGAICITQNKIQVYDQRCGLPNSYAFNTFIDKHNNIYIALWNSGVVIIEPDKMVNMFANMDGPATGISIIRSFIEDEKGIWLGTYTNGLICMQTQDTIQYTINGKYTDRIFDIKKAPGGIWLSIYGHGVTYLSNTDIFSIRSTSGLVTSNAYYMMQDSFHNLWISDLSGGFSRLNENLLYQRSFPNKSTNNVEKMIRDDKKGTWVFTGGSGLFYLHDSLATRYMNKLANGVASIYYPKDGILNKDGSMWVVGYDGEGIMYGKGQDFVCYKYTDFKEHGVILFVQKDADEKLWFSTNNYGVISYDNKVFRHYTDTSGLLSMYPLKLFLDAENKVCCSFSNGFQRFNKSAIQNLYIGDSLFTKQVNCLFVKDATTSFMGVNNHGLYLIHQNKVYQLNTKNGLASNNIRSIVMDAGGKIWVTTDKGIENFIFDGTTLKEHRFFNQSNGDFVSVAGLMLQDESGNPYWTSGNKKMVFNSVFQNPEKKAPVFTFTQVLVDEKKITTTKKITILPDQKIDIDFTAIYWGRENFLRLNYLLISNRGDTVIRNIGNRGNISINEILPGNYKIVLIAKDNNETYYSDALPLVVSDFWYNTWGFRIIFGSLLITGIVFYYRQKAKKQIIISDILEKKVQEQTKIILNEKDALFRSFQTIETQNKEKDVLIDEINHRVKNNLQFIAAILELQLDNQVSNDIIQALLGTSRRIKAMSLVHELLYIKKEQKGLSMQTYIHELVENLKEMAINDTDSVNIKIEVDDLVIDSKTALSLGMIISELVSNSFKHAFTDIEEPEVQIQFNYNTATGLFRLRVSDNGNGYQRQSGFSNGLGLSLIDIFSRQLAGEYTIQTAGHFIYELQFKIIET